jgi:hypothetical protein
MQIRDAHHGPVRALSFPFLCFDAAWLPFLNALSWFKSTPLDRSRKALRIQTAPLPIGRIRGSWLLALASAEDEVKDYAADNEEIHLISALSY